MAHGVGSESEVQTLEGHSEATHDDTVAEAGANVLILGGAPLTGLADRIKAHIPVPLIDPVQAATKQAESLVALQPRKAQLGAFSRPPAKETVGLTSALAGQLARAVRKSAE